VILAALERCESGRIGLTANELTWETGSEGSNPSLSAVVIITTSRQFSGQFPRPFVQAVSDSRSNPARERSRTHQRAAQTLN
jgi:hypothetical protein